MKTFLVGAIGVEGVIALALVGAVITLALTGREVPEVLGALAVAACGYYFGKKGGALKFTARWLKKGRKL